MKEFTQHYTDVQYKQNARITDQTNIYIVQYSIDMFWLTKEEKYKNKYLTGLLLIGKLNKEVTNDNTSKELNTDTNIDTNNDVH